METVGLGMFFEDLPMGRKFKTIGRTVTDADITNFVNATGMVEVLFTNLEFLKEESDIKGRVAPGALGYTFAEGLLVQSTMQHTGLAMLETTLKILGPTNVNDTIHVEVEVLSVRPTSKGNRGIVKTMNNIVNQTGETVGTYEATRMMAGR